MALTDKLTAIGDAIRYKTGGTSTLTLSEMPNAIKSIEGGGSSGGETNTSLWTNGSWEEIQNVLNRYYAEEISDLSPYFNVGDKRKITISAIEAGTDLTDAHEETVMDAVIIGIEHDDLETPVSNNRTKSALTIQLFNIMNVSGMYDTFGGNTSASTCANHAVYTKTKRRNWLNQNFYNALPIEMQPMIKPVVKKSSRGINNNRYLSSSYRTLFTSTEKVFLLSYTEAFSGHPNTNSEDDGVQYDYYKNRYNFVHWKQNENERYPTLWWSRTSMVYATNSSSSSTKYARFYTFSYTGDSNNSTNGNSGICPAWCL